MFNFYVSLIIIVLYGSLLVQCKKPNIVIIMADDMGWNDVGFHGSNEIPTPNIDALAYNGVILNGHYSQALCTPSRSAFLTGKYPIHLGMQHLVILEPEPWGLGLNETILPQYLQKQGYRTHLVGKWHLGFFKKEYTPTYRGFDTHYGYWQGLQDYYDHSVHSTFSNETGYDMRRNMDVDWDAAGKYTTNLLTSEAVNLIKRHDDANGERPLFLYLAHLAPHSGNDRDPLQAPDEEIARFAHIDDPERRVYAAMVSMLDRSVGEVMAALRERRMLNNTIIVFMSDNGSKTFGVHSNHGSNYPLRGMKNSAWEGATRNVAAVWSPLIKKPQRVSNHLMHISDWLPTLFTAAGLDPTELATNIDGKDMWRTISESLPSPRTELLYNIDDVFGYGAIRAGDWKYLNGTVNGGKYDGWYGATGKEYDYDPNAVLRSETATILAAFETYRQIDERQRKDTITVRLLSRDKLLALRSRATVSCAGATNATECRPMESPCLFHLADDPCERVNLALREPSIVRRLERRLAEMRETAVAPRNVPRDPNADPVKWNNTWTNWYDHTADCDDVPTSPLVVALIAFLCLLVVIVCGLSFGGKVFKGGRSDRSNGRTSIGFEIVDDDEERERKKKNGDASIVLSRDYDLNHIEQLRENGRTID